MVRANRWIGFFLAVMAFFGLSRQAHAVALWSSTTVGTGTGGSVTVGGLTITATSCTAKVGGTDLTSAMGGCSILNLQLNVVTGTASPEIEILGTVGSTNTTGAIFSTANSVQTLTNVTISENSGLNDLLVTLTITSATAKVNNVGAILTGSITGSSASKKTSEKADISMSETIASASPAETASIPSFSLSSLASGVYSGSVTASTALALPTGGFTVNKDIRLTPPTSGSDTLTLASVIQIYKTPEPFSLAVFAIGLAGLAATRHRRRLR